MTDKNHLSPAIRKQKTALYVTGFASCVALTLAAFGLVEYSNLSSGPLVGALATLALAQIAIQLIFFLHIGEESKPKWKILTFGFMFITVLIVVVGSLWIMQNLDYNMSSHDMTEYMRTQNQKGF